MELLCDTCGSTMCICHKCLKQKNYDKCDTCSNTMPYGCEVCENKNTVECPECNYNYCRNKVYEFDLSRLDELL